MKTINWKVIITATFCVFLTTACSKKLMPPEIETSAGVSEGTELTARGSLQVVFLLIVKRISVMVQPVLLMLTRLILADRAR